MSNTPIQRYEGTPEEIGWVQGARVRAISARYDRYVSRLLTTGLFDVARLRADALAFLDALPIRFRDELRAFAAGARIPLETVARLELLPYTLIGDPLRACTSIVARIDGRTWAAHNNDWFDAGSHEWCTAVVRSIPGRRSTLVYGVEGSPCAIV